MGRSLDTAGVTVPTQDDDTGWSPTTGGVIEELVFGTRNLAQAESLASTVCVRELGSSVSEVLFRETSVGVVFGLLLDDGRRVVLKGHQPRERPERLAAVHAIQRALWKAGLPCPEPLAGPVALAGGHATVEALLDEGEYRDTHDPHCRRLIAEALAQHLAITGERRAPQALHGGWNLLDGGRLWPAHAHSPIFDFEATAEGAEWIDALGERAKGAISRGEPLIAGHCDWSGKHFRFAHGAITAIYDWDSLAARPEAALVGIAAMTYTTHFDLPGVSRAPTPGEMRLFIDEYSSARDQPLNRAERSQIAAHGLLIAAYTARCEHCGQDGYDADADPASFTSALRTHGSSYLDE